ncbi:hypothetical protein [Streptomyces aidingensis]|nr:hypothetical protein [Streptomyces aidingensis]
MDSTPLAPQPLTYPDPVRALRRCLRCGCLTQDSIRVEPSHDGETSTAERSFACPQCAKELLRRCYRCHRGTRNGTPVRDIDADFPDGYRLVACPDCITAAERDHAARHTPAGGEGLL